MLLDDMIKFFHCKCKIFLIGVLESVLLEKSCHVLELFYMVHVEIKFTIKNCNQFVTISTKWYRKLLILLNNSLT